jgi:hypothetical protein
VAVDKEGNTYIARNHGYAATPGAYQNGTALSVTKLNRTGTSVVYTATFGSGELDRVHAMTVDGNGNLYLVGQASSSSFPTTPGAFQTDFGLTGNGFLNAFVMKLNAQGSTLIYATFLKGDTTYRSEKKGAVARGIVVDAAGNAVVTGFTNSSDFPQSSATPETIQFGGFLTKLNATGSALVHSLFLRGTRDPKLALDAAGNCYVAGGATEGFASTPGALQIEAATSFLMKLSPPRVAVTVSAASYAGEAQACEAIVSAFGSGLATATRTAVTTPLPTNLAGTTIKVKDRAGVEREAPLFFVSPTQVNFQIPPGTANGAATITITSSDGTISQSQTEIVNVAPSLFSADATGRGLAAAQIQRAGSSTMEPTALFDPLQGQIVAVPIDLSATNQIWCCMRRVCEGMRT